MLNESIKKLVQYGIDNKLIPECERIYSTNMLLEVFGKEDFIDPDVEYNLTLDEINSLKNYHKDLPILNKHKISNIVKIILNNLLLRMEQQ